MDASDAAECTAFRSPSRTMAPEDHGQLADSGDVIDGRWVVESTLGRGGMGSVYRCAAADGSGTRAAIKVLATGLRGDEAAKRRFVREAEVLMRLDHPAIVRVRHVEADDELPYIEMEFIRGRTLGQRLEEGELEPEEATEIGIALFEALAYLHGKGVQHRDIKPDNLILREEGGLVLVDFGLALDADASRLTQANMAFGTVAYAPPEWLNPGSLEPVAWDLYAGGVVLWELLTSKVPFPASGVGNPRQQALQVMMGKQTAPPLDPGPAHPPLLRVLVRELTHPRPERRPPSAVSVLRTLVQVRAELDSGWDGDATPPSTSRSFVPLLEGEDTHVPAPYRSAMAVATEPHTPRIQEGPDHAEGARPLALLAGFVALFMLVGLVLVAPGREEVADALPSIAAIMGAQADDARDVRLQLPEVPEPLWLSVMLDDRHPDGVRDNKVEFARVSLGDHLASWTYGEDCSPVACGVDACPSWCGVFELPLEITSGEEELLVPMPPLEIPSAVVRVTLAALENPRRGLFKRRERPAVSGTLGAVSGQVEEGHVMVFTEVPPGRHKMLLSVGECDQTPGCWPDGICSENCRSEERMIEVGWSDSRKTVVSELPLPN